MIKRPCPLKSKHYKKKAYVTAEKRLLIIDDEENMRHMLKAMLGRHSYNITTADNGKTALEIVQAKSFDYILCDVRMPEMNGLEFLKTAKEKIDSSTVIMMSAYGNVDLALEAMKAGAYDFISKPFKTDEVLLTLKKAEEREALKSENKLLKNELEEVRGTRGFEALVGESNALQLLVQLARKVAPYNTTILITGESGSGKELVAKGIHASSSRKEKAFLAVNCGSIPSELLESELFGYVKGAFTGADKNKKGLFEEADGGTLFLDEIGELPVSMQVKLLRVLQENEVRPVGASAVKKIDVRILAATAKKLEEAVQNNSFREDLFYRLNVMSLHIPPLRNRSEDIPLLCRHFIDKFNRKLQCRVKEVSPTAMNKLLQYRWPGNVRELENVIQRGVVLTDDGIIDLEQLPTSIVESEDILNAASFQGGFSLKEAQKELEASMIERALKKTNGNKSKASLLLQISYPSLLSKIKEYGIVIR